MLTFKLVNVGCEKKCVNDIGIIRIWERKESAEMRAMSELQGDGMTDHYVQIVWSDRGPFDQLAINTNM